MKNVKKLCRRLGLGLRWWPASGPTSCSIPCPTSRGPTSARPAGCSASIAAASAIPHLGGSAMRVPLMTAYRQEALRCAELLRQQWADEAPKAVRCRRCTRPTRPRSCGHDHYGWFERVERGVVYARSRRARVSQSARLGKATT